MYPSCVGKSEESIKNMFAYAKNILLDAVQCVVVVVAYCNKDVKTPHTGDQMKHAQLARLIELCVLALGEVEAPVHFLQCDQTTDHVSAAGIGHSGCHLSASRTRKCRRRSHNWDKERHRILFTAAA